MSKKENMPKLQGTLIGFSILILLALLSDMFLGKLVDASIYTFGFLFTISICFAFLSDPTVEAFKFGNTGVEVKKATPSEAAEAIKNVSEIEKFEDPNSPEYLAKKNKIESSVANKEKDEKTDADYLELATLAWKDKDLDKALSLCHIGLDKPVSSNNITASLYSRLGTIWFNYSLKEKAEEYYLKAIQLKPDHGVAHYNYANLLYETGRNIEAEEYYLKAIQLKLDYAEAHYNHAILLEKQNRLDEAKKHIEQAIKLMPSDNGTKLLAIINKKIKNKNEAE